MDLSNSLLQIEDLHHRAIDLLVKVTPHRYLFPAFYNAVCKHIDDIMRLKLEIYYATPKALRQRIKAVTKRTIPNSFPFRLIE